MPEPSIREEELLRQIAALEEELAGKRETERQLRELEERLRKLLEAARDGFAITERGFIVNLNPQMSDMFGYQVDEMIGMQAADCHPPEWRDFIREKILSDHELPYEATCQRKDGSTFLVEICGRRIQLGERTARVTAIRDISALRLAEETRRAAAVQDELIRSQASLLAELAAPILPIAPGVLVLPLIGRMNAERAQRILDALGREVVAQQAQVVLLDITGLPEASAMTGDGLLRGARMVGLLGARVILTGIRPEVARRLVELEADLAGLVTCGTLEQGVALALGERYAPQARRRADVPGRAR